MEEEYDERRALCQAMINLGVNLGWLGALFAAALNWIVTKELSPCGTFRDPFLGPHPAGDLC